MNRRSFLVSAASVGAAAYGGFWFRDNVMWPRPAVVFEAEPRWTNLVPRLGGLPVIEARIAERRIRALIDSGAQYSVLDRQLADGLAEAGQGGDEFEMPLLAYGVGGQAQMGRGTKVSTQLGGLKIDGLKVGILDLGPLASDADGPGVSLIIGRDVLGQVIAEIDVKRQRIRFSDPARWQVPVEMHAVPLVRRSARAVGLDVMVEGHVVEAVLDTGASGLLSIAEAKAREAGLLDGRERIDGESLVLGGVTRAQWVEASELVIAGERFSGARVAVFGNSPLPNYPDALVGMGVFKGRRMALDLGGRRLFVSRPLDLTIG